MFMTIKKHNKIMEDFASTVVNVEEHEKVVARMESMKQDNVILVGINKRMQNENEKLKDLIEGLEFEIESLNESFENMKALIDKMEEDADTSSYIINMLSEKIEKVNKEEIIGLVLARDKAKKKKVKLRKDARFVSEIEKMIRKKQTNGTR